jgi:alkylhydroperoxidase family enzyme
MPRLRQVPRAEAPPNVLKYYDRLFGERDPVAEPGTATGTPGDWWTVFALVPPVFDHATAHFGMFGMFADQSVSKLDPVVRELGILRAAYVVGSQFVYSQHCKAARRNGMSEAKIAAIPDWTVSDAFSADERALLAYADCLALERGRTPDGVFAAVKRVLSDEDILEFTYHVCGYMTHATMCRALKLEFDNVEERIREVPVPGAGELVADWSGGAWAKKD